MTLSLYSLLNFHACYCSTVSLLDKTFSHLTLQWASFLYTKESSSPLFCPTLLQTLKSHPRVNPVMFFPVLLWDGELSTLDVSFFLLLPVTFLSSSPALFSHLPYLSPFPLCLCPCLSIPWTIPLSHPYVPIMFCYLLPCPNATSLRSIVDVSVSHSPLCYQFFHQRLSLQVEIKTATLMLERPSECT